VDHVVSQLLTEVDGLDTNNDVFVISATNRLDLLDSALIRPGRFDQIVYLGVCEDRENQVQILYVITHKLKMEMESFHLHEVAEICPMTYTGADFQALCSDALRLAIRDSVEEWEGKKEKEKGGVGKVIVKMKHFHKAISELRPSVSQSDLIYYKSIQEKYSNENNKK
jgi:peroxin-6